MSHSSSESSSESSSSSSSSDFATAFLAGFFFFFLFFDFALLGWARGNSRIFRISSSVIFLSLLYFSRLSLGGAAKRCRPFFVMAMTCQSTHSGRKDRSRSRPTYGCEQPADWFSVGRANDFVLTNNTTAHTFYNPDLAITLVFELS